MWRVTAPLAEAGLLVEYLLLCVPHFDEDYVYEWETQQVLLIRER